MTPSGSEVLKEALAKVPAIEPAELNRLLQSGEDVIVVDVREADEWRAGRLPGAIHIPRGFFELQVDEKLPEKNAPIVLYCEAANRSTLAALTLIDELGYTNVSVMNPGLTAWREAGFEIDIPKHWTPNQKDRYSRHFVLPEVGEKGQKKISEGKVLVVGAGGLGSPALLYLGAAGVGTIGIVDFDHVEENNLQRQVIHSTPRIGVNKAASAKETIEELNPDVKVQAFEERLTAEKVDDIVKEFDVIIDATDNFDTRYMLNDAAVKFGKPYIYGSIFRFEGMASVFWPEKGGPCYRCMYPEAPPAYLAPT
ncbi:MAG: ThiF family adenylyltransferase [Acidimicrobiia bacterium]